MALAWFHARGYLLYYGDAASHLGIGRRLWDSRTPGYEQIGTVWLPLPHWILALFTHVEAWWRSGLAGGIPSAAAEAAAAVFLFAALRNLFASALAAWTGFLLFLLNPNALYLGSTPMTEPYFALAFLATLYCATLPGRGAAVAGGIAACAGTLVRYDGWFVIPFFGAWWLWRHGWRAALIFVSIATAGPLYWLAHNRFYFGDALEFFRGPYSARAIQGRASYPGEHDWLTAIRYFSAAANLVAGAPLAWIGAAGAVAAAIRRQWLIVLLALPPVFYVLSMYAAGNPIFVPHLWPNSHYNTRYGLAALPLVCVGAAAIVGMAPAKHSRWVATAILAVSQGFWAVRPGSETWICWKESDINSKARREWVSKAAAFLRENYREGDILTSLSDLVSVFREAGIPLRQTIHEGNSVFWLAEAYRPKLFLRAPWVVAMAGDRVHTAVVNTRWPHYDVVARIEVKGAPVVEIFRRGSQVPDEPAAQEEGEHDPEAEAEIR
ncbi:MAG: hypothetical protein U0Q16_05865 [Bryobacteraceae bacterium]